MQKSQILANTFYNDELKMYYLTTTNGYTIEVSEKEVEDWLNKYKPILLSDFTKIDDFDDKLTEYNFDHTGFAQECLPEVYQTIMEDIALQKQTQAF